MPNLLASGTVNAPVSNTRVLVYATGPCSAGRTRNNKRLRFFGTATPNGLTGTWAKSFTATWIARFGVPIAGYRIFVGVQVVTSKGARGPMVQTSIVIS